MEARFPIFVMEMVIQNRIQREAEMLEDTAIAAIEIAWAAGFWEGEGTVIITTSCDNRPGKKNRNRLVVTCAQKELASLIEFKRIAKCGSVHYQASWDGYQWVAASKSAREFLHKIIPHLHSPRRIKAVNECLAKDAELREDGRKCQLLHLRSMSNKRNEKGQFVRRENHA